MKRKKSVSKKSDKGRITRWLFSGDLEWLKNEKARFATDGIRTRIDMEIRKRYDGVKVKMYALYRTVAV